MIASVVTDAGLVICDSAIANVACAALFTFKGEAAAAVTVPSTAAAVGTATAAFFAPASTSKIQAQPWQLVLEP